MRDEDLQEKVRFLSTPGVLCASNESVSARETHMSWVFLTRDRVFKLKKPVRFPYLDFSTVENREAACREELSINQQLAPGVYLRLARLARSNGSLSLDGHGPTVDWLVVMQRLPETSMLDARLKRGGPTLQEIETLASMLAQFYLTATPALCSADDYVARLRAQLLLDRETLTDPALPMDRTRSASVLDRLARTISRFEVAIRERAQGGGLVEGHGDLRPEHVCLERPLRIIDRLEFNRELRLVDPFDELAFLAMECDMAGAEWIGPVLIERARETLPQPPPEDLVQFYKALRASLRARLSLAHLRDATPHSPEKWPPLAERYLNQAERALALITEDGGDRATFVEHPDRACEQGCGADDLRPRTAR